MTKFSAPLAVQPRSAGQLGAALFLALGLFVACGNDTPEVPEGSAGGHSGRGNSAGRAGKGGEGAEAGEAENAGAAGADGSAGDSSIPETGGTGGKGGSNGSSGGSSGSSGGSSGGKGGTSGAGGTTGGAGPTCGNGKLEAGEACDDGNTKFGDTCSPTCTNICEKCEKDVCGPDPNQGYYDNCFGDGFLAPNDVAKTGPKAGTKKNVLCPALVACLKRTGCSQYDSSKTLTKCYCGTASAADCKDMPGAPNGPCAEEIAAAGESRNFLDLTQRQNSPQYALGLANVHYGICDGGVCATECVLGKAPNQCQQCIALQAPEESSACFVNPKADPNLSAQACTTAVECVRRSSCAQNGLPSCYGTVASDGSLATPGPCATELAAAGKGMTPSAIRSELANPAQTSTLGVAATEVLRELDFCPDQCFPNPNAGGGSGGGGNAGGGGRGGTSGAGGG